jgi:hypothetical protein
MRKGLGRHSTAAGTVWPNGPFFCGRFGGVFEQPSHPNPAHIAQGAGAPWSVVQTNTARPRQDFSAL